MPINFPTNPQLNDIYTSGNTSWQWNGSVWNVVSSSVAVNIPNAFSNFAVTGQSTVSADSTNDTVNLIAGSNVTITTSTESDSITINSAGAGEQSTQNLWATVSADTGATTANTATDTLTVVGGSDISTSISGDTLTIAYTGSGGGATNLTDLTDVNTASLSVDKIYLPAITRLVVNNSGASAYLFDQYSGNNPTIYGINGTTIAFDLDAIAGHPFLIQTAGGSNYDTGLVHVSSNGTVSTGSSAQGKESGTLYWKIPASISGTYRYQCSVHGSMVGSISIKDFTAI